MSRPQRWSEGKHAHGRAVCVCVCVCIRARKRAGVLAAPPRRRVPRTLATLQARVEQLLVLLARALGRCRAEPELLLPLGRVAMQLMPLEGGGEGLALLQLQAAGAHCQGEGVVLALDEAL